MVYKTTVAGTERSVQELLDLAEKKKLDLEDVEISEITRGYLEYLKSEQPDADETSQFLYAVTKLLSLKVKALMPSLSEESEDEEDLEIAEELARHLMEYKTFKEAAVLFQQRLDEEQPVFARSGYFSQYVSSVNASSMLDGIELSDLVNALERVLQRDAAENSLMYEVPKQEFRVADKMEEVIRMISGDGNSGIEFENLFSQQAVKGEIIVTFLALLELVRMRKVRISQNKTFGTIMIYPNLTSPSP